MEKDVKTVFVVLVIVAVMLVTFLLSGKGVTGYVISDTDSGLLSVYHMDGNVLDSESTNPNHGVISGSVTCASPGVFDEACNFNGGTGDYVSLGNVDITGGSGMTLSAWVYADSFVGANSDGRIISKALSTSGNDHWWMISTLNLNTEPSAGGTDGDDRLRFRLKIGTTTYTLTPSGTSSNLQTGEWFHVAATYDGTDMKLYKDGVEIASANHPGTIATDSGVEARIGGNPGTEDKNWDGRIDDVGIWNRALSASEINILYQQSTTPECNPGNTRDCGSDVGACSFGTETCDSQGFWEGTCVGGQGPVTEMCSDTIDNDCDGDVDSADSDCQAGPVCGSNGCESGETCSTCPADCGTCTLPSGDVWYVRPISGNGGDGSSWNNAFGSFDDINWNSIGAGDVLYVAGGTYIDDSGGIDRLEVEAGGTLTDPIFIRRATVADHGSDVGWQASYDSGVIFKGLRIRDFDNVIFDGVSSISGRVNGFHVDSALAPSGFATTRAYWIENADNVVVKYVSADGSAEGDTFSGFHLHTSNNLLIDHASLANIPNDMFTITSCNGLTIQNSHLGPQVDSAGGSHPDVGEIKGYTDLTWRYNIFDWESHMLQFGMQNNAGGQMNVYGNIFYSSENSGPQRSHNYPLYANSDLSENDKSVGPIYFYNNIVHNTRGIYRQQGSNIEIYIRNNIFWDLNFPSSNPAYSLASADANNNYFHPESSGFGHSSLDPGDVVSGNNPFVDIANRNYRLVDGSLAIDAGAPLTIAGHTPEIDSDGNIRGNDGSWDIGAFEHGTQLPQPACGDGNADPGEECGEDGLSCGSGETCNFITCQCVPDIAQPVCGDGFAEGTEECDGSDLDGASCVSVGFDSGTLGCVSAGQSNECTYDVSGCSVAAPSCTLENAAWSTTSAVEGETVQLIIDGTNCDGDTLNIEIYEEDGMFGSSLVDSLQATFIGDQAVANWNALYIPDTGLFIDRDPEYSFEATHSVSGVSIDTNILLEVTEIVVGGSGTYYVDYDNGDDSNDGQSTSSAWKHAPGDSQATGIPASISMQSGDVLLFRGGVHYRGRLDTVADGVTYKGDGWGSEKAIIDGSEVVSGTWTQCPSAAACGDNSNWQNLYYIDTPDTSYRAFTSNLYLDNQKLINAQGPNQPNSFYNDIPWHFYSTTNGMTQTSVTDSNILGDESAGLISPTRLDNEGAYIIMHINQGNIVRERLIDGVGGPNTITFDDMNGSPFSPTGRWSIMNSLHENVLDQPGEFYLDEANDRVYVWPHDSQNPSGKELTISTRMAGIGFDHSDITIEGLVIQKFMQSAIARYRASTVPDWTNGPLWSGDNVANIVIQNNELQRNSYNNFLLGIEGVGSPIYAGVIYAHDVDGLRIEDNNFYENHRMGGAWIGNSRRPGFELTDVHVIDNTFDKMGWQPIWYLWVTGGSIVGNTISNSGGLHANGISLYDGTNDILVKDNIVDHEILAFTLDRDVHDLDIVNNVFKGPTAGAFWGQFFVPGSWNNVNIYNNIFDKTSPSGSGLILDCNYAGSVLSGMDFRNNILDNIFFRNTGTFCDESTFTNQFSNNIYVSPGSGDAFYTTTGQVVSSFDNLVNDASNMDYSLVSGSAAIDSGMDPSSSGTGDLPGSQITVTYNPLLDITGLQRPSGSAWDIGPYEFGGQLPQPPGTLVVDVDSGTSVQVNSDGTFEVTFTTRCIGGSCGDVSVTLDPQPSGGSE